MSRVSIDFERNRHAFSNASGAILARYIASEEPALSLRVSAHRLTFILRVTAKQRLNAASEHLHVGMENDSLQSSITGLVKTRWYWRRLRRGR
jgi:hypothetical protein